MAWAQAHRLARVPRPHRLRGGKQLIQGPTSRGADLDGVQLRSVGLPVHRISRASIFGQNAEELSNRHDSGSSAEPNVKGGRPAIEKVGTFQGLKKWIGQGDGIFGENPPDKGSQ